MPQHRRAHGLKVVIRQDTGTLQIVGTVAGQRVRQAPQSNNIKLAREEAATLEASLLRAAWHGERRGTRSFTEAALSYLAAEQRSAGQKARVKRLADAFEATHGDLALHKINQQVAVALRRKMLRAGATDRTYVADVLTPLRAILHHAQRQGWCDMPYFAVPKATEGRTFYLLPDQVRKLIAAAAPHLRPLLIFLVGTGARMAEAIELEWRDVDLQGARAIFWADQTKMGKRRNAELPPAVVAALANLPYREGRVFRWQDRAGALHDYADKERRSGGQIKTAWQGALKRTGLAGFTRHDLRHTWASWHYAIHKDPLKLMVDGGWSSLDLVKRYAHLLPAGNEPAIREIYGA